MKVILVRDVARLGRKSEVKEVPSGHAQNFLIPRKLAVPATPENLKRWSAETARQSADRALSEQSFREALAGLAETPVTYRTEANEQGHLFKGVNIKDIASTIQALGFSVTEEDIILEHPLKTLGTHEVKLVRGGDEGVCTLTIVKK